MTRCGDGFLRDGFAVISRALYEFIWPTLVPRRHGQRRGVCRSPAVAAGDRLRAEPRTGARISRLAWPYQAFANRVDQADPYEYLAKYRKRYYGVHVKDFKRGKAAIPVGGRPRLEADLHSVKAANIGNIVAEVARTARARCKGRRTRRRTTASGAVQAQRGVSASAFGRVKESVKNAKKTALALLCGLAGLAGLVAAQTNAGKTLDIYYIDTEGGQSTLFVSPTGESLLVDTGNAGGRDLERIVAAIDAAGVKQIDHMWTTHYHGDHVGAMEELAKRVPIRHFYDHGPLAANDRATPATFFPMYEALSKGRRTTVKPGDKVPMAGLESHGVVERRRHQDQPAWRGQAESGVRGRREEG